MFDQTFTKVDAMKKGNFLWSILCQPLYDIDTSKVICQLRIKWADALYHNCFIAFEPIWRNKILSMPFDKWSIMSLKKLVDQK